MNARLASRAGRLRRRTSIRRLGEVNGDPDGAMPLEPDTAKAPAKTSAKVGANDQAKVAAKAGAKAGRAAKSAYVPRASIPVAVTPATMVAFARETYNVRRRRARFLPADLFGEPTWDILLDLYVASCENRSVPTTSACIGAHVPPTTALRWLRILEARGLVEREDDGNDGRRMFVRLSDQGLAAMEDWLRTALASLDQISGTLFRQGGDIHMPLAEAAE